MAPGDSQSRLAGGTDKELVIFTLHPALMVDSPPSRQPIAQTLELAVFFSVFDDIFGNAHVHARDIRKQ